jgi:hypothetical protein
LGHVNNPDYDWVFATEPQVNAHGRVVSAPRYVPSPLTLRLQI